MASGFRTHVLQGKVGVQGLRDFLGLGGGVQGLGFRAWWRGSGFRVPMSCLKLKGLQLDTGDSQ